MCIYFGNTDALTYKNQEHVFPAGLGGKSKLPVGVVSDQANKLFSPFEMQLMRESLLAVERMFFGPGDRGSLEPSKASKSLVNVGIQDDGTPALCYIAAGKPYNIPQFHMREKVFHVSAPDDHNDSAIQIIKFVESLQRFSGKFVHLSDKSIGDHEILVGFFEDKYYIATSGKRPEATAAKEKIELFLNHFKMKKIQKEQHQAKQQLHLCENPEIARVYAKVAMNVLAFIKGESYARNANFDEVRQWIVTGKAESEFFYLPSILTDEELGFTKVLPEKSHWCIFNAISGNLEVMICFYNQFLRRFTFGLAPEGTDRWPFGFICDWKNGKEFTLDQFIINIAN